MAFIYGQLSRAMLTASFLAILLSSGRAAAQGADRYWVCGDGFQWNARPTMCWASTPGGVGSIFQPFATDLAHLTQSGATDISVTYYDPETLDPLTAVFIDGTGAGAMTLNQTVHAHDLMTDDETVGEVGTGFLNVTLGAHTVNNDLWPGDFATGDGSVSVSDTGSLSARLIIVGKRGAGHLSIINGGTVSSLHSTLGSAADSIGTATVIGAGSSWDTSTTDLIVGSGGDGSVSITNGGALSSVGGNIGLGAASNGMATVDGAGSSWTNSGNLVVGQHGIGGLSITDGGTVSSNAAFLAHGGMLVGDPDGVGDATVDGVDSRWDINGDISVGYRGVGNLSITNGGTVSSDDAFVGNLDGSDGTVTVDGAGSTWDSSSGRIFVGNEGDGSLSVTNGGVVFGTGNLGQASAGSGTVIVDGAGSTWNGSFTIGDYSSDGGSLSIVNGGTVVSVTESFVGKRSNGIAVVEGAGSSWTAGELTVGRTSTGSLIITGGGTVSSDILYLGHGGMLGGDLGGNGAASVDGVGSRLDVAGYLYVGFYDVGSLSVTGGATVSSVGSALGHRGSNDDPTISGTATADGPGSTWTNDGDLDIGRILGEGTLNITNGGVVISSGTATLGEAAIIGLVVRSAIGTVTVDGPGSTWTNGGDLFVGVKGIGSLSIANSAVVSNTTGYLGFFGDSIQNGEGTATVDGLGSTWTNTGELYVGVDGVGILSIANRGTVSNTTAYIGFGDAGGGASQGEGTVTVDGAGSTWTSSGELHIGVDGVGSLSVTNEAVVSSTTGSLGSGEEGVGTVTVSGAGSTWTNSDSLSVGANLPVTTGSATLTVENAGTVNVTNQLKIWGNGAVNLNGGVIIAGSFDSSMGTFSFPDGRLTIDGGTFEDGNTDLVVDSITGTATLQFINGASKVVTGDTTVGDGGTGVLNLINGGMVSNTIGHLAHSADSTGTVTVDGTGSNWSNSGELNVGRSGVGALSVTNGGTVSNTTGNLGLSDGSSGTTTVDGAGSSWSNSGELYVGRTGIGNLRITGEGTVSSTIGYVGSRANGNGAVTVDGVGSQWINSGDLLVGDAGTGELNITTGGIVPNSQSNGYLGFQSTGSGTVTVDGVGSTWNSAVTYIGHSGSGQLNVTNGGTVSSIQDWVGYQPGSSGGVKVDGTGSHWTNNTDIVVIGNQGTGSLSITDGGMVSTGFDSHLGFQTNGDGTVTVDGAGSTWNIGFCLGST